MSLLQADGREGGGGGGAGGNGIEKEIVVNVLVNLLQGNKTGKGGGGHREGDSCQCIGELVTR